MSELSKLGDAIRPIAHWEAKALAANRPNSPIAKQRIMPDEEADKILNLYQTLYECAYRPKYYWALQRLGAARFISLAERALGGERPQHLFRFLVDRGY